MEYLDKATALRLTDAATVLLDAAREQVQAEARKAGRTITERDVLALATQILFYADFDLKNYGGTETLSPQRTVERSEGIAAGLGAIIGNQLNPLIVGMLVASCSSHLRKQTMSTYEATVRDAGKQP